jgi:hypothetical protein
MNMTGADWNQHHHQGLHIRITLQRVGNAKILFPKEVWEKGKAALPPGPAGCVGATLSNLAHVRGGYEPNSVTSKAGDW